MRANRAFALPPSEAAHVQRAWRKSKNIDSADEMRAVLAALSINTRKALACAPTEQVIEAVLFALPWHLSIAGRTWLKQNPQRAAKIRAAIAKAQADIRAADKTEAARA